jgi:sugar (pentulose or hexulose) kinase
LSLPVTLIFDIGKTTKKIVVFDNDFHAIEEQTVQFPEIKDDEGFPEEDLENVTNWVINVLNDYTQNPKYQVTHVNFSTYGASMVHLDRNGKAIRPFINYLKPLPLEIKERFFKNYDTGNGICQTTASPYLGLLNSGLQLYWLKYQKPDIFSSISSPLHFPQYFSTLLTNQPTADITSIGCHTMLWDFERAAYHEWVKREGIDRRLAPVFPGDGVMATRWKDIQCGAGLHDSSSALIPYLAIFNEPFLLISTGTWSISMNPFNDAPLTEEELQHDCLCFLTYKGKPVKASRVFAGNEHEKQVARIADRFDRFPDYSKTIKYDGEIVARLRATQTQDDSTVFQNGKFLFADRDLSGFKIFEEAYHQLMLDIIHQQVLSTDLIRNGAIKKIFVDGGFVKNDIYMKLLSLAFPQLEVYGATVAQASAIGAALAIHPHWNNGEVLRTLIELSKASVNTSLESPLGA